MVGEIVDLLPPEDERRLHFPTVVVHGDVVIDGRPNATDTIHHGRDCPPDAPTINIGRITQYLTSPTAVSAPDTSSQSSSGNLPYLLPVEGAFAPGRSTKHRQHYRIVYKEVGVSLSSVNNRKDMFLAIQGPVTGTSIPTYPHECLFSEGFVAAETMHSLGYVHRDISTGNVLLVESPPAATKRGILTDFEYAIKLGTRLPVHKIRTGTPFFMACEVEAGKYLAFNLRLMGSKWTLPRLHYNRLHGVFPTCSPPHIC